MASKEPQVYNFSQQMFPNITFVGFEKRGFASRGCRIHTEESGERFVLLGPPDPYKAQRVGLTLPHSPTIHRIEPKRGSDEVYTMMDATDYHAEPLLNRLRQAGLHTIQTETSVSGDGVMGDRDLQKIYTGVVGALADLHAIDPNTVYGGVFNEELTDDVRVGLYQEALDNIITDPQRLDGIAGFFFGSEQKSRLSYGRYEDLRSAMRSLSIVQSSNSRHLRAVHGDAWSANIFVSEQEPGKFNIELIDPAILFSDPALDVVFSLFDVAAIYAHSGNPNNTKYLQMADDLVDQYIEKTGDIDLRKRMPLFYGYKSFVSAVFDIQDNEERRMATFHAGLGAVLDSIESGSDFYFSKFAEYEKKGLLTDKT